MQNVKVTQPKTNGNQGVVKRRIELTSVIKLSLLVWPKISKNFKTKEGVVRFHLDFIEVVLNGQVSKVDNYFQKGTRRGIEAK